MEPQLLNALIALAVIVLGGLGTLVSVLIAWLAKKLDVNTSLTQEAKDASNGRLSETLSRLATERDRVMGLRYLVRERDDRIAYIVARLPEAESLMTEYRDRRDSRLTQADEVAAEQHAMGDS
jgi:hypothetical protein